MESDHEEILEGNRWLFINVFFLTILIIFIILFIIAVSRDRAEAILTGIGLALTIIGLIFATLQEVRVAIQTFVRRYMDVPLTTGILASVILVVGIMLAWGTLPQSESTIVVSPIPTMTVMPTGTSVSIPTDTPQTPNIEPTVALRSVSNNQVLLVSRTFDGVAICVGDGLTPVDLSELQLYFAIGAGERYTIGGEVSADVSALQTGDCVCLRQNSPASALPTECANANQSNEIRGAEDWRNTRLEMRLTGNSEPCVIQAGITTAQCEF